MTVEDHDFGHKAIMQGLHDMSDAAVYVGIRQENGEKPAGERDKDGNIVDSKTGATISMIATYHEFGAPKANIPERSFLRSTVDANLVKYQGALSEAVVSVMNGEKPDKALAVVGLMAARDVRMGIRQGTHTNWPALAESTVYRKSHSKYTGKRRGKGSKTTTLIDTGRLVQSIDYQVSIGGKDKAPGKVSE